METISSTVWQRKGSSVIYDEESLGPFIAGGAIISLRQALAWQASHSAFAPIPGRTIVIYGLETLLEILPLENTGDFLMKQIRPLIFQFQRFLPECGVVFGFSAHEKAFEESLLREEVLFRRRDNTKVPLSEGLWDGSATVNMKRLVSCAKGSGNETQIGYYVARIS